MKIRRIVLIVLSLILVVALVACKNTNDNLEQSNHENVSQAENKEVFYFIGSQLVAKGKNGNINSLGIVDESNITYDELLSQNYYTAYSLEDGTNRRIDKIKLAAFENTNDNNIASTLMSYGEKVGSDVTYLSDETYDVYEIALPAKVSDEIANLEAYDTLGDNGYGFLLELAKQNTFVTSADFDIKFEPKLNEVELSNNVTNKIKDYMISNELKDVSYTCTDKFATDLDGDNNIEKVYVIETNVLNENDFNANIAKTGALSLILIEKENEGVEIIFESNIKPFSYPVDENGEEADFWSHLYGYVDKLNTYIADLDNDNDKEIIVDATEIQPERGNLIKIYNLNNDKYEEVITAYYGLGH